MHSRQALIVGISVFAFAACNPFHREPVTEVSRDVNLNTRWRATLVSPASLAGAVQIKGTATAPCTASMRPRIRGRDVA